MPNKVKALLAFIAVITSFPLLITAHGQSKGTSEGAENLVISSIPRTMTYQGILTDNMGDPIANTTLDITFRIYNDPNVGDLLWSEVVEVTTNDGGYFDAILSNVNIPFDDDYWLELQMEGEVEPMTPRQKINMSAYSARADTSDYSMNSDLLDGLDSGDFLNTDSDYGRPDVASNLYEGLQTLTSRYVNEGQNGSITGVMIVDGTIQLSDIGQNGASDGQVIKWDELADNWVVSDDETGVEVGGWVDDGNVIRLETETDSVGIGTYAPSEKLEVAGNIKASGKIVSGSSITIDGVADKIVTSGGTLSFDDDDIITTGRATIGPSHVNSGVFAFVAGYNNSAIGDSSTIGGGAGNIAGGLASVVGGGANNKARGEYSVIGGGGGAAASDSNLASGYHSTISGGKSNVASIQYSTVGGGVDNAALNEGATVGGGGDNIANGGISTIAGGLNNTASGSVAAVGGGTDNTASGAYSLVGGGNQNSASDTGSVVGGGFYNYAESSYTAIGGGYQNLASGRFAAIAGGINDTASGTWSSISGGIGNRASADFTSIGGGGFNLAIDISATVSGGFGNNASGRRSSIGGGYYNIADDSSATVSGGELNEAISRHATVGGGLNNTASANRSTIGGGMDNNASGGRSTIAGGEGNAASQAHATVGGGQNNAANGISSTVAGGENNQASSSSAAIGGGLDNTASGQYSAVSGGRFNTADVRYSAVGGGYNNYAVDTAATISGGRNNRARGKYSFIGGGGGGDAADSNLASEGWTVVGGGRSNAAISEGAVIGGGWWNVADGYEATVGGGSFNHAVNDVATVAGGTGNNASNFASAIGGGGSNDASGRYSSIPGGLHNDALGDYSFAAGRKAISTHAGTFVWGDSTDADFTSTGVNQFLIRASGGVGIGTNSPGVHAFDVRDTATSLAYQTLNFELTTNPSSAHDLLQIKAPNGAPDDFQFIECERGTDVKFRVHGNGDVTADGTVSGGGADFAEMIKVSTGHASVEAGDVMIIDPDNPRAVVKSSQSRSTLVAGIVSFNAGFIGSERDWDKQYEEEIGAYSIEDMSLEFNEIPLAIVGIVTCKVSSENGPIRPGDLLVTSSIPGYAMRDDNPKTGTIVGKALDYIDSGTGVIKILVTLH